MSVFRLTRNYQRWLDREETERLPLNLLRLYKPATRSVMSRCVASPTASSLKKWQLSPIETFEGDAVLSSDAVWWTTTTNILLAADIEVRIASASTQAAPYRYERKGAGRLLQVSRL